MFGRGVDVQSVEHAYRYHLAAKLSVKNWGKHEELPVLFQRVGQRELIRGTSKQKGKGQNKGKGQKRGKGPDRSRQRQPLAPSRHAVVQEVLGMLIYDLVSPDQLCFKI